MKSLKNTGTKVLNISMFSFTRIKTKKELCEERGINSTIVVFGNTKRLCVLVRSLFYDFGVTIYLYLL